MVMKGHKYCGYRPVKQVAVSVREDLKDAVKLGLLPAELKFSVTIGKGTCSVLRVKVSGPAITLTADDFYTEETKEIRAVVSELANAYNRNESDIMTDYWDIDYFLQVSMIVKHSWEVVS